MMVKSDTKKIRFTIGDIFKADDLLSKNILWLFMIYNDLMRDFDLINKCSKEKSSSKKNGKLLYLIRLNILHLNEAGKAIKEAQKNRIFTELIESVPESSKEILDKKKKYKGIRFTAIKNKLLRPLRNSAGHYIDLKEELNTILNSLKIENHEMEIGHTYGEMYFEIADLVLMGYFINKAKELFKNDSDEEVLSMVKNAVKILSEITKDYLVFIDNVLPGFYESYMQQYSTVIPEKTG